MLKFAIGVVVGVVLVPFAVVAYLVSGHAPAATADPPMPFESRIADMALQRRIQKEAPVRDLSGMSAEDLLAGADIYKKDCAMCHGLPDEPPPAISQSMFPEAPQLMKPPQGRGPRRGPQGGTGPGATPGAGPNPAIRGRTLRPDGDFWRVKNGVRLTGMPSFQNVLSEGQMWQVIGLLANRRRLPPEVKDALRPESVLAAPAQAPALTAFKPKTKDSN